MKKPALLMILALVLSGCAWSDARRYRCGPRMRSLQLFTGTLKPDPFAALVTLSEESDPDPTPMRRLSWQFRGNVPLETVQGVRVLDGRTGAALFHLALERAAFEEPRERLGLAPGEFGLTGSHACWPGIPCWSGSFTEGSPSFGDLWHRLDDHGAAIEIRTTDPERPVVRLSTQRTEENWHRQHERYRPGC